MKLTTLITGSVTAAAVGFTRYCLGVEAGLFATWIVAVVIAVGQLVLTFRQARA